MQVLFCQDGPLRVDENNYYGISHNDEVFQRYTTIANNIAVAIRTKKLKEEEKTIQLSKITISPFRVYDVPDINSLRGLFKRRKARKIIKQAVFESDYIVARLPSMIGNIAIDYAKKYDKPYLTEVVGCPWDTFLNHSFKGKLLAPYMYLATKNRVKNSRYVVYVTNSFLQKRYPTNGNSVSCSDVTLKEFNKSVLDNRINRINHAQTNDKVIIGTLANVNVRYKGQQYIIQALSELKKQGITNFEYQLVGAGDQNFLESIAKKHNVSNQIKFLGPLLHNEVFEWLETIDIYAQPSRTEGLPRALIEAMSQGLPTIGANTGGIPELLEDKVLFSNTKKNIQEICAILLSFDKDKMIEQAKINYKESKKYDKKIIDKRRKEFFIEFRETKL